MIQPLREILDKIGLNFLIIFNTFFNAELLVGCLDYLTACLGSKYLQWTHIQVFNSFGLYQDYKNIVASLKSETKC